MATARIESSQRPSAQTGLLLFGVFLALFLGVASVFLPALFVLSVLVVPVTATLVLLRPEYALTACIALVCGLIHPALVPRVPIFGGALAAADAALAMLAIYAAWTFAVQAGKVKTEPVTGGRLLAYSLTAFGVLLVIAVTTSLTVRGIAPNFVLGETRDLLYVITLPIALVILRQPVRQHRFVVSFVVLGCLFSVGQILQGIFNIPVFGTGGMSVLETLGYRELSTTRSNTHGLSVIIFALLLTVGAYVLGGIRKPLFFPVAALLLAGIFLTFGRTTFATVAVCVFMAVSWLNARKLPQLAVLFFLLVSIGAGVGGLLKPQSLAAVYYRMTSIGAELDYGYSAGWRFMEFDAMLPHIQQNPLTGIGLGADYKGVSGSSTHPELNQYIHNAYLYMAGKMGVPALLLFLVMMVSIFVIGRRLAKSDATPWVRVIAAASAVMMIRFWIASLTEPHLMSDHGIATIALCGALVLLAARRRVHTPPGAAGRPSGSLAAARAQ
jgi:O-antigen ligase